MTITLPLLGGPQVIMTCGPAGSGKTTLAEQLHAGMPGSVITGYDRCREVLTGDAADQAATPAAVALALRQLTAACQAGRTCIVDGTHLTTAARDAVRAVAATHHLPTALLVLDVDLHTCLIRQHTRARQVPAHVVRDQHAALQRLLPVLHHEPDRTVHLLRPTAP
jgi:predicted kinase